MQRSALTRSGLFVVIYALALSGLLARTSTANEALKDELLREAPKAWREYLECFRTIKFTFSCDQYEDGRLEESEPVTTFRLQFPYYAIVESRNEKGVEGRAAREISARNKKYRFGIKFNNDGNGEISYIEENEKRLYNQYDFIDHRHNPKDYDYAVVQSATSCLGLRLEPGGVFLPPFLEDELFQILDVEEVFEGDLREYKVQFEYHGTEPHFSNNILRRGTIFLLPDHMWVVKKVDFIENSACVVDGNVERVDVHVVTTLEYDFTKASIPLPTSIEDTIPGKFSGYNNLRFHYELDFDPTFTGLNEKECYLSYYGFPEPDFVKSHAALRASLVAGALFLFYLAFRNWNRRRKARLETIDSAE